MNRKTTKAILVVTLPALLSGCAAQVGGASRNEVVELRRQLLETRRELDAVRRDQDRLRNSVEYLQYSRAGGQGDPNSPGGGAQASYGQDSWSASAGVDRMGSASAYDAMSAVSAGSAATGGPTGAASSSAMQGQSGPRRPAAVDPYSYNDASRPERGVDPRAQAMGAAASGAQDAGDSRIVAGVRGGGSWTEPGHTGVPLAPPTVPTKLRGSNYEEGVRAFNDEHYDDAIQYFRDFIHQAPQSDRADDAQFWIGESYLRKGMHSNAIKEFNQVVLRYSSGDRSAAALLKLAEAFSQIGDQVDARLSLQKLVNRYPGSNEAAEAYRLLQEMGS
jgi:tol-pal system protein YbgF